MNARRVIQIVTCWGWLCAPALLGQWQTQTLVLQPGWNSIYLSIAPTPVDCDSLFAGNPRIVSIRRWAPPPLDAVQYDEVTGTTLPESGSWLTWFPPGSPDRALLNLAQFDGGAAYLFEISGAGPLNLVLQGRPLAFSYTWRPGTHHFTGLPVHSPAVSFSSFFADAGANIPVEPRDGGEIYFVRSDGGHQRIFTPVNTFISPGIAYWIKAQQYSTYAGSIEVKVDSPNGWLDFGDRLVPAYVDIRNVSSTTRGVKVAHLTSAAPPAGTLPLAGLTPLKYAVVNAVSEASGRVWQALPPNWTTQLLAGASVRLALLPDALGLAIGNTNTAFQSILEITDDVGQAGLVRQRFGIRAMARLGSATESRGLWVGDVNVTDVGRLKMPRVDSTALKKVARPFTFRLLAHVDTAGTARLLQRVFVGTRPDTATGGVITDLIASEARVAAYKSQYPAAKVFRLSSANFPFMAPALLTNGAFGVPNQAVRGSVAVTRDDPVNPFLHAYAPLHDNKERRAEDDFPYPGDVEVFSVRRALELIFEGPDAVNPEPRWGEIVCGGVYKESILGLGGLLEDTNRVIQLEGRFVLHRASPVATLLE